MMRVSFSTLLLRHKKLNIVYSFDWNILRLGLPRLVLERKKLQTVSLLEKMPLYTKQDFCYGFSIIENQFVDGFTSEVGHFFCKQ